MHIACMPQFLLLRLQSQFIFRTLEFRNGSYVFCKKKSPLNFETNFSDPGFLAQRGHS